MGFREAVEAHGQEVGSEGGQSRVLLAVHDEAVVNLIGEEDEVVLPGDGNDLFKNFPGIQGAGGVIGVDDDNALGFVRHLPAHVLDVRVPVRLLVADVMHGLAAGEGHGSGPEGIIGRGDEHLVTVVEQALHGKRDELAHAVAGEDIVDAHVGDALLPAVLADSLAGAHQAVGIRVALRVGKLVGHIVEKHLGRPEAEIGGVADVEFQDIFAAGDHSVGFFHDRAANIIAHMIKLM